MSTYGLQSYLETARQLARRHGGGGLPALLRMLAAKAAYGLSASEYGLYGLHGRPWSQLRSFMTKKQTTALFDRINPHAMRSAVEDKLEFHRLCIAQHLPVPRLHAVLVHDRQAAPEASTVLSGFRDVMQSLSVPAGTRLILKPRRDALGTGVRFVELRDSGPFDIRGEPIDVDAFDHALQVDMQRDDYLIQGFVVPHPVSAAWGSGKALGTLRVVTFVQDDDVHLLYALARIPCGDNVHDNFTSGSSGNLIANVDVDSGRLGRAFGRRDLSFDRLLESFDRNPDTGRPILGQTVPDWDGVRDTLRRASFAFRTLPLLGWDVALSSNGVVIIEANSNPDIIGAQVSSGFGARELLRRLRP